MERCQECKHEYPERLLSAFYSSNPVGSLRGGTYKKVCGICALAMQNAVHGTNRKRFDGPMAEQLRQEAIAWRKKEDKPCKDQ